MRIHEIINESERQSIWITDDIIKDDLGGTYYYLTRINQRDMIDGFAMVYKNPYINTIKDPDDNVVVSYTMPPGGGGIIFGFDYSKHRGGTGEKVGIYIDDEDVITAKTNFLKSVGRHI